MARTLEGSNPDDARSRYRQLIRDFPGTTEAVDAQSRLDSLTGASKLAPLDFPQIAGRWSEGPGLVWELEQDGTRLTGRITYTHPEAGEIRAELAGTIDDDGKLDLSVRHTKAPADWVKFQRRTATVDKARRRIDGTARWSGGEHAFSWTREP
jgi:hypothetical protein